MTIEELTALIKNRKTFQTGDPLGATISDSFQKRLINELNTLTLPEDYRLEYKDKYIALLKGKIEYLEDFIVRLARDSQDI